MRRTIFLLALALTGIFVMAQAQDTQTPPTEPGCSSEALPDVDQRLFGHAHQAVFDFEGGEIHSLLSGAAQGKPGTATLSGWLVNIIPGYPDESCPEGAERYDIARFEWGEVYEDGSLLQGGVDPGQFYCASADEGNTAEVTGTILGGRGRFEGASGTWSASVRAAFGGLTGTLKVYCNN
jgi:hypothetical protein